MPDFEGMVQGWPAVTPVFDTWIGTVQMSNPVTGFNSWYARRLPLGPIDHADWTEPPCKRVSALPEPSLRVPLKPTRSRIRNRPSRVQSGRYSPAGVGLD